MKAKGRHPDKALSAATVRAINEPGLYADGNGLYLKVDGTLAKRWVQRLVIMGKRRDIGLGSAKLVSLAEARELAAANRKTAREGGDPTAKKRLEAAIPAFRDAARTVFDIHKATFRNAKHSAQWLSSLETYVFPIFGDLPVSDVTSVNVLAALTPIWTAKPETARRVRQRIGAVLKWAIAKNWRADNPADAISKALPRHNKGDQEHRPSLPYTRVSAAIEDIKNSEAAETTKLALEFLILTATRSGEVRLAKWQEIDLVDRVWTIPKERMKTNKAHRAPLSDATITVLDSAMKLRRGDLVFPGAKEGRPISDATLSKLMRELNIGAVPHGFRSSFRVWAGEQTNFPREVAEFALAHVTKDKAEAAYARTDLFEKRRKLMDAWAAYLCKPESATVVALSSRKTRT